MPFKGTNATTRRERFLYLRQLYLARKDKHVRTKWYWETSVITGKSFRAGIKWEMQTGPKIDQGLVNGETYDATILPPFFHGGPGWFKFPVGPRRPPTVHLDGGVSGIPGRPLWHRRGPQLGFHQRGVKTRTKRRRKRFWTAFNLRVRGCNWHYFKQGYFPDDDVLGRRPNMTDAANGVPPGVTQWPEPSGYDNEAGL